MHPLIIYPKYGILVSPLPNFETLGRYSFAGLGKYYNKHELACCVCKRLIGDVSQADFTIGSSFWLHKDEFVELDNCYLITCGSNCNEIVRLDPSYESYTF